MFLLKWDVVHVHSTHAVISTSVVLTYSHKEYEPMRSRGLEIETRDKHNEHCGTYVPIYLCSTPLMADA